MTGQSASKSVADLFGDTQQWQTKIYQRRLALNVLVRANPRQFRSDFIDWLEVNFSIWTAFEIEASRMWNKGRKHYSARTIAEWIRHDTSAREAANEYGFKLNNSIVPDLARLYLLVHPDRDGFFEFRVNPLSVRSA